MPHSAWQPTVEQESCEAYSGGAPLHKALAGAVPQDTALTAGALRDEAASAVNACRVELYKLQVLQRNACASGHRIAITGAGVGRCRREVCTAVSTRGQNGLVRMEAVDGAILHAQGRDTLAGTVFVHDEIHGKVLDCTSVALLIGGGQY